MWFTDSDDSEDLPPTQTTTSRVIYTPEENLALNFLKSNYSSYTTVKPRKQSPPDPTCYADWPASYYRPYAESANFYASKRYH
jgi:hypothetical protein